MIQKASLEASLAASALRTLKGDSLAASSTEERGKLSARWGAISEG